MDKKTITGPKPPRHVFGFLDETGLLMSDNRLFGMGLMVPGNNRKLHKELVKYRQRTNFNEEFKFSLIRRNTVELYKGLIDIFFENQETRFVALFFDKELYKVRNKQYKKAYNTIAGKLVAETVKLSPKNYSEYITVLADDVSTADDDNFEKDVRNKVKNELRRNALFGMCRLESHALTEIQLCDVLLGLVAYAHKVDMGIIEKPMKAKLELVKYIQKRVGVSKLSDNCEMRIRMGVTFKVYKESKFN